MWNSNKAANGKTGSGARFSKLARTIKEMDTEWDTRIHSEHYQYCLGVFRAAQWQALCYGPTAELMAVTPTPATKPVNPRAYGIGHGRATVTVSIEDIMAEVAKRKGY